MRAAYSGGNRRSGTSRPGCPGRDRSPSRAWACMRLAVPAGIALAGRAAACKRQPARRRRPVRRDCPASGSPPRPQADASPIPSQCRSRNDKGYPYGAAVCWNKPAGIALAGRAAACKRQPARRRRPVRRDCPASGSPPRPQADASPIPSQCRSRNDKGYPYGAALVISIGGAGGNRTRVRKSSTISSTCVVTSLYSRCRYADAQAQPTTSYLFFSSSPSSPARHDSVRMTLLSLARPGLPTTRCSG